MVDFQNGRHWHKGSKRVNLTQNLKNYTFNGLSLTKVTNFKVLHDLLGILDEILKNLIFKMAAIRHLGFQGQNAKIKIPTLFFLNK